MPNCSKIKDARFQTRWKDSGAIGTIITAQNRFKKQLDDIVPKRILRVYPAEPYRFGAMGSFGDASYMLLRQYQFPDTYSEKDKRILADHDRCMMYDFENTKRCFKEHTGTGELGLENWLKEATDEKVIEFLVDILKADVSVKWTGYRIMGGVHGGNGYPVWTLELFYKHPESDTVVYTGPNAPNVRRKKVYESLEYCRVIEE